MVVGESQNDACWLVGLVQHLYWLMMGLDLDFSCEYLTRLGTQGPDFVQTCATTMAERATNSWNFVDSTMKRSRSLFGLAIRTVEWHGCVQVVAACCCYCFRCSCFSETQNPISSSFKKELVRMKNGEVKDDQANSSCTLCNSALGRLKGLLLIVSHLFSCQVMLIPCVVAAMLSSCNNRSCT